MATIVLDPGHGGLKKIGGSSPNNASGPTGLLEKTVTLDIALRAKSLIEALGHKVKLTRATDDNLGLANRAAVAKAAQAPVFVSIHMNGYDQRAQGTETWLHSVHTMQSAALAQHIQQAMLKATKLKDRFVQAKELGVLDGDRHWSRTACCLVEISFMDVAAEEARLKTETYRDALAAALCDGVAAYLQSAAPLSKALAGTGDEDGFAGFVAAAAGTKVKRVVRAKRGKSTLKGKATTEPDTDDRNEYAIIELDRPYRPTKARVAVAGKAADPYLSSFRKFVAGLGLRHVTAESLLHLGGGNAGRGPCAGKNDLPPRRLWPNIARTAQMLDEIAERLGGECYVHSAYRNLAYNSCVGGEKNSYHSSFFAIDFSCAKGSAAQWHKVACEVRASDAKFEGGVGKYDTFVHIDTRGYHADW